MFQGGCAVTRQVNPKSTDTYSVKAKDEIEKRIIGDFKALALQDGKDARELFFQAVDLLFKVHHWPPGNPQLTLTNYHVKPIAPIKCGYANCNELGVGAGVYLPKNKKFNLCSFHFGLAKNTPKVWDNLRLVEVGV